MDKCPKCGNKGGLTNSCICKSCKKEYMRRYYLENKQDFINRNKKNMTPEISKKCYEKHKIERTRKQIKYAKATNYKHEKTESQRKTRGIKRKTIYHFPLSNNIKCELCSTLAQCHHHNTEPIKYDKFNFSCNNCHKKIYTQLNFIGGTK